ncbi:hypothetical protein Ddye_020177 [Dipteronia dyeriana]|uniref:RWP-RK domain-containing protein n=1 Tax=Dipteronia dyeriana TaxID=168575 RepID=A0AAD9TZQ8_9ROSI|nr:hypothetical protein Ddye_020177 [Dipteronia dyeriana]
MADPGGFVHYNDPNESSFGLPDNIFDILNTPNNNSFGDLSLITEPFMHHSTSSSSVPQSNANIGGSSSSAVPHSNVNIVGKSSSVPQSNVNIEDADHDPIYDPIVSEAYDMINRANSKTGPSQERPESDNNHGNMRELVVWPVPPVPFLCSCCLVLREIIHSNGIVCTKLEIHGRLGMICHAILEIRQSTNSSQYHIFDFCNKSIEDVKNFLVQYCGERNQTGFYLLREPLSIFYEALCVGLNFNENVTTQPNVATNEYTQPPVATNSGANAMNQAEVENVPDRRRNPSLSVQRERTTKLTLNDLVPFFHLPIEKASRKLRLCATVVKKICRRSGVGRWPYRKINSINNQISRLSAKLTSIDSEERVYAEAEIQRLQDQITFICSGRSLDDKYNTFLFSLVVG